MCNFFFCQGEPVSGLTMDAVASANTGQFRSSFQHILRNVFVPVFIVGEK